MNSRKETEAVAEISLSAAVNNFFTVRHRTKGKLCCVVKANAYGHGAGVLGCLYEKLGADFLAVANPEEALSLRAKGLGCPILVLGYAPPAFVPEAIREDITLTVYSREEGELLSRGAKGTRGQVTAHLKLDTGMGRLGFSPLRDEKELEKVCHLPGIRFTGVYTHFARADMGKAGEAYTRGQLSEFLMGAEIAESAVGHPLLRHAANSGGILDYPEAVLHMVRAGILLYGVLPGEVAHPLPLTPVMTLRAPLISVREIPKDTPLSYGGTYVTTRPTRVGVIPLGYADGIPREAGERGCQVALRGGYAPILGRVCMDQTLIDLTETGGKMGDTVTLFGEDPLVSAAAYASHLSTIPYELLTGVGQRVRRIYL